MIQINDERGSIARRLRDWRQTMTRAMAVATAIGAMVLVAGCGGPSSPSPPVPRLPPPTVPNSAAALEITSFELSFHTYTDGSHWYEPEVVLTEKSGTSAVLLDGFVFDVPGGNSDIIGGSCLSSDSRKVSAGGTWQKIHAAGYCLPEFSESIALSTMELTVKFIDEHGVPGSVTRPLTAPVVAPVTVLEITRFELSLQTFKDGSEAYVPKVVLTEKSGVSAALLHEVAFGWRPGGIETLGEACMPADSSRTVPAGGTWNDSQLHLGCIPVVKANELTARSRILLTVNFTDEHGVRGYLRGGLTALK